MRRSQSGSLGAKGQRSVGAQSISGSVGWSSRWFIGNVGAKDVCKCRDKIVVQDPSIDGSGVFLVFEMPRTLLLSLIAGAASIR